MTDLDYDQGLQLVEISSEGAFLFSCNFSFTRYQLKLKNCRNNSWKSRGIKILVQKLLGQEKIDPFTAPYTIHVCSNFDWVMEFLTCGYKISLILPKK